MPVLPGPSKAVEGLLWEPEDVLAGAVSPEGGLIMVTLSSGSLTLQKALLQLPCLRTRRLSVVMITYKGSHEGAYGVIYLSCNLHIDSIKCTSDTYNL